MILKYICLGIYIVICDPSQRQLGESWSDIVTPLEEITINNLLYPSIILQPVLGKHTFPMHHYN